MKQRQPHVNDLPTEFELVRATPFTRRILRARGMICSSTLFA